LSEAIPGVFIGLVGAIWTALQIRRLRTGKSQTVIESTRATSNNADLPTSALLSKQQRRSSSFRAAVQTAAEIFQLPRCCPNSSADLLTSAPLSKEQRRSFNFRAVVQTAAQIFQLPRCCPNSSADLPASALLSRQQRGSFNFRAVAGFFSYSAGYPLSVAILPVRIDGHPRCAPWQVGLFNRSLRRRSTG
jgi:hypothetical protein